MKKIIWFHIVIMLLAITFVTVLLANDNILKRYMVKVKFCNNQTERLVIVNKKGAAPRNSDIITSNNFNPVYEFETDSRMEKFINVCSVEVIKQMN